MLECVVNISEGRRTDEVGEIASAASWSLLDIHSDPWHNRSVLTLAGPSVEAAARAVAAAAVRLLDIRRHEGVHPRLGALDVVPFVPLASPPPASTFAEAVAAREDFAAFAAWELGLPCFLYGTGRSLPEIRRSAFRDLEPDVGPAAPHPTAGACCVGARPVLVAYNVCLDRDAGATIGTAGRIARSLRSPAVRSLAFDAGGVPQVSCNLLDPASFGPADVYDAVAKEAPVLRAELVGLLPRAVLDAVPVGRLAELDLSVERTIEARLEATAGGGTGATTRR